MNKYSYDDLEKHFTFPIIFYKKHRRIPRKLKKKVKNFCSIFWKSLNNNQRLWYYLEKSNPDYKAFLIKIICKK